MKFDFFSRKKFKCDICKEKFKTETELTTQQTRTWREKIGTTRQDKTEDMQA
ncbi:MAG: hypothetical protein WCC17_21560 [Candidatus Nitrosopolaris sp.]